MESHFVYYQRIFLLNQIIIKVDKVKSCISLDEICEMEFTYKFILFNWFFFKLNQIIRVLN